ncbi:alpha/beta hydrolase [Streptomyces sp. NBC_00015]|uniref:alpha/beta fold hydrolase n=1 Tax=unclassified Streptomyces TaxID=2593676 RepID=UPI00224FCF2F|nr:alpha/beta hydrolase [Streptomyces sp. NBC_00103]MCX5374035.1 alpha/beta hydrolase [Streptomyces sp. NBC_00103]
MSERWEVREAGPADASHRVLMIPGALCTTAFYADLMAEPAMAGLGTIAATLPGFGRTEVPEDVSVEHYARLMADFAAEAGCDTVVGHSLGANVAIEMAAAGLFTGPVVLLSPAFSRGDESRPLSVLNTVARVPGLGTAAWAGTLKRLPREMADELPPRARALAAVMGDNDPAACRRIVRQYYAYLDRYPSLVPRLCEAGVPAWVVRGDRDEIGLTDAERRGLEACRNVRTVAVPDAGHFALVEQPARVAAVVLEAVTAAVR